MRDIAGPAYTHASKRGSGPLQLFRPTVHPGALDNILIGAACHGNLLILHLSFPVSRTGVRNFHELFYCLLLS
jgi:hypothetical protein